MASFLVVFFYQDQGGQANKPKKLNFFWYSFLVVFNILQQFLVVLFKASALWVDAYYKSKCPFVSLFVCLFTFEVPFKLLPKLDVQSFQSFGIFGEKYGNKWLIKNILQTKSHSVFEGFKGGPFKHIKLFFLAKCFRFFG